MQFVTCECTCKPDEPYADGSFPLYTVHPAKAAYWLKRCREKAKIGVRRSQSELVVDSRTTEGDGVISRSESLSSLKEYNLYFGVHLVREHILAVK